MPPAFPERRQVSCLVLRDPDGLIGWQAKLQPQGYCTLGTPRPMVWTVCYFRILLSHANTPSPHLLPPKLIASCTVKLNHQPHKQRVAWLC